MRKCNPEPTFAEIKDGSEVISKYPPFCYRKITLGRKQAKMDFSGLKEVHFIIAGQKNKQLFFPLCRRRGCRNLALAWGVVCSWISCIASLFAIPPLASHQIQKSQSFPWPQSPYCSDPTLYLDPHLSLPRTFMKSQPRGPLFFQPLEHAQLFPALGPLTLCSFLHG